MTQVIETNPIPGFLVYGMPQVEYTVDGVGGRGYALAASIALLATARAIEEEAVSFSAVLKARQKKLEELGMVLSILTRAADTLPTKDRESTDKTEGSEAIRRAKIIMERYGMSLNVDSDNRMTRATVERARNDVEYSMDLENNDLQQDMVSMQSFMNKRNNAFSTATKLIQKAYGTSDSMIQNM